MQAEIGSAAGTIWRYLNDHGEVTLSKVKPGTKLSDQLLFAGIGWLAREEKVNFTAEGRSIRVCLAGAVRTASYIRYTVLLLPSSS